MAYDEDTRPFSTEERREARGELLSGTRAGKYVIERFIARGGYGAVYAARRDGRGDYVAIKVLNEAFAGSARMIERFIREVDLLRRLSHPSIVEIHEVGTLADGRPFYVMEYLQGKTLGQLIQEEGRLGPEVALELLEPVCAALDAAHREGIVHRDVKASNIFILDGSPWQIRLLDFGIAKLIGPEGHRSNLTTAGRLHGTPAIMAPEQILGGAIDGRVDVYALGVLLHRMLTGRLPFESRDTDELVRLHLEEPPPRPSSRTPLSPALDAVVLRCMQKQPDQRFDSVKSFLRALREAVGEPSVGRDSVPDWMAPAVALLVQLRVRAEPDEMDDALICQLAEALELCEAELQARRFILASATGSELIGVRLLEEDLARAMGEKRHAIEDAAALYEKIMKCEGLGGRIKVNVCVHVGRVHARVATGPEIIGGALMCTGAWAPEDDLPGPAATREAALGLDDLMSGSGPAGLLLVRLPSKCFDPMAFEPTLRSLEHGGEQGIGGRDRSHEHECGERALRKECGAP